MGHLATLLLAPLGALILLAGPSYSQREPAAEHAEAPAVQEIAVIVHPKNPVTNLSLAELRSILKLEKQFWPNGRRVVLYLPPSRSVENEILLDKIYRMPNESLQKYWMGKLFSNEIPAKPSYAPNAKAAGSRVKESEGAIAVVLASEVPEGVRVLAIGDSRPGDQGYTLSTASNNP